MACLELLNRTLGVCGVVDPVKVLPLSAFAAVSLADVTEPIVQVLLPV